MPQNTPNKATPGPWREGRPSFKAFYPEIFFLTLLTIVALVCACRLSCARTAKPAEKDAPQAVSFDAPFGGAAAFAQDASLDAAATAAPDGESAENAESAENETSESDAAPQAAEKSVETPDASASPAASVPASSPKKGSAAKFVAIWVGCLLIPVGLWCWRGWIWICAVYGTKYKLVCDPDNLKATTFLITRGIFNKKTDSLHIGQIKDIQSQQSLWQKYAQGGVGTIILFTSDLTDKKVEMANMAEPSRVFNAFDELRRHYWGRGGMQLGAGPDGAPENADADGGAIDDGANA